MKIFDFFKSKKAAVNRSPWDNFWYNAVSSLSAAGVPVTPENAMKLSSIWACNKVISETVGSVPLILYRRLPGAGKERAIDDPLYKILRVDPNTRQTSMEYRETMQTHLNLYGNAYSIIDRGSVNGVDVESLGMPIHPLNVRKKCENEEGDLIYYVKVPGQEEVVVPERNMLHIRGLSLGGCDGISPIQAGADSIGLAMAAEAFGASFFKNKATPAMALTHPNQLSPEAQDKLRDSVRKQGENGVLVLEEEMKVELLSTPPDKAQFIETRQFEIEEVCRWYRVPPHKIAHLLRATFSNIEHQSLEFVQDTMLPWFVRWEQRIDKVIINEPDQFVEFLADSLLRGDKKSRNESYQIEIQNGIRSPNEVRVLENLNPREGGDEYWRPMNMQTDEEAKANSDNSGTIEACVDDIATRIAAAEEKHIKKENFDKDYKNKFYIKHKSYIMMAIKPLSVNIEPEKLTSEYANGDLQQHIKSKLMESINGLS